jgi:hypothetical protein
MCVELYLHSPICLPGVVLSKKTHGQLYLYLYEILNSLLLPDSVIVTVEFWGRGIIIQGC